MTRSVGVLGAGQLGRMLALAGAPLGMRFVFVDPKADSPASTLGQHIVAEYTDAAALDELAKTDVVTYEFENIPTAAVESLKERVAVCPPLRALSVARDRLEEKRLFSKLGIPTPRYMPVATPQALALAVKEVGLPCVLKTRTEGYDGKGQVVVRDGDEVAAIWAQIQGRLAILESFVSFSRELSVLAVRASNGSMRFYPLMENVHDRGVLRTSRCLAADAAPALQEQARSHATKLMGELDYVGVLALELFQVGEELWANEIAPRVHNTGHFSIEGARTSQFENHLRAITGLPLGETDAVSPCAMINCVGAMPSAEEVLAVPDAHLHDYKKAPRPGRKVGHVTVRAPDSETLSARLRQLEPLCPWILRSAENQK